MTEARDTAINVPVLAGMRVTLRPWRESDKDDRKAVGRHAEFVHMCGGEASEVQPFTDDELDEWYASHANQPHSWAIEWDGHCIGEARLHGIRVHDRWAYYAIGLWDPTTWDQGLGREATRLVLGYAFNTLGLHRVALRVLTINERAIACYEACGFVREGIERESCPIGDLWFDDMLMGVLDREFAALP